MQEIVSPFFSEDILDRLSLQIAPVVLKLLSLSTLEGRIEQKHLATASIYIYDFSQLDTNPIHAGT